MTIYQLILARYKSESPAFYDKVFKYAMWLGGLGVVLLLSQSFIPLWVVGVAKYMSLIGITAAFIAKSTTKDKDLMEKSEELLKPKG